MKSRILTALSLFPPVIYLIGWSPLWLFGAAIFATAAIALQEYFAICRQPGLKALPALGYAGTAGICLVQAMTARGTSVPTFVFICVYVLLTLSVALFWIEDLKQYFSAVATTILGVLYVALPLTFLMPLRFKDEANGRQVVLFLFIVIWAGDIFAYFVGRTIGRHFLFPRVSPKKTFEGAIAGLAGSILVGWGFAHWFWRSADLKLVIILAGVVAIAGQIGDFAESALKRGAGMKDSGSILPGHGGMLDRIDALLFGAVTLWLALSFKDLWPL